MIDEGECPEYPGCNGCYVCHGTCLRPACESCEKCCLRWKPYFGGECLNDRMEREKVEGELKRIEAQRVRENHRFFTTLNRVSRKTGRSRR